MFLCMTHHRFTHEPRITLFSSRFTSKKSAVEAFVNLSQAIGAAKIDWQINDTNHDKFYGKELFKYHTVTILANLNPFLFTNGM